MISPKGKKMKKLFAVFLCVLFPVVAFAGDNGYKIGYDGGSVPGVKAGAEVKLYIEGDKIRIVKGKADLAIIPASAITEISYGQDVHRRVGAAIGVGVFTLGIGALMALSKSKKHFIVSLGMTAAKRADLLSRQTRTITGDCWQVWKVSRARKLWIQPL
jgi:CxxC motif-containing protein (DUF1111 family)